jgi:hypothetical protein
MLQELMHGKNYQNPRKNFPGLSMNEVLMIKVLPLSAVKVTRRFLGDFPPMK